MNKEHEVIDLAEKYVQRYEGNYLDDLKNKLQHYKAIDNGDSVFSGTIRTLESKIRKEEERLGIRK